MIRLCSQQEAIDIFNQPKNMHNIGLITKSITFQPWICSQGSMRMAFVFWMVDSDTCEAHIVCSEDAIIKSRELAKELIAWLFSHGVNRVVTNCPKGRASNMAKKIGMKKYKTVNNQYYYEVLSWA
jgi:hypothetical protein